MSSKKFVRSFLTFFVVLYASTYLLYYLVNPEQIFKGSITSKKFYYSKEYSRKHYEMLKEQPHVLVFGSSQIHRISSEIMGKPVLNMHNIYCEPGDILNFLTQLDEKQLSNVDKILFVIDLRAGAHRIDDDLINYSQKPVHYPVLTLTALSRTLDDIVKNWRSSTAGYLNADGSIEHVDPNTHIKRLPSYPYPPKMDYHDQLISDLLEINRFALANKKDIIFFTPVTNRKFLKSMDFEYLQSFFEKLLSGGIEQIKFFYFVEGLSDLRNENDEPMTFLDPDHLNAYYVKKWLHEYILEEGKYDIGNESELSNYIDQMQILQASE